MAASKNSKGTKKVVTPQSSEAADLQRAIATSSGAASSSGGQQPPPLTEDEIDIDNVNDENKPPTTSLGNEQPNMGTTSSEAHDEDMLGGARTDEGGEFPGTLLLENNEDAMQDTQEAQPSALNKANQNLNPSSYLEQRAKNEEEARRKHAEQQKKQMENRQATEQADQEFRRLQSNRVIEEKKIKADNERLRRQRQAQYELLTPDQKAQIEYEQRERENVTAVDERRGFSNPSNVRANHPDGGID